MRNADFYGAILSLGLPLHQSGGTIVWKVLISFACPLLCTVLADWVEHVADAPAGMYAPFFMFC